jgi:hypothetical protein
VVRSFLVLFLCLSFGLLGCGKAQEKSTQTPSSQPAPATQTGAPAAPTTWKTVTGGKHGLAFTLQVPSDWIWDPQDMMTAKISKTGGTNFNMQVLVEDNELTLDDRAKKSLEGLVATIKQGGEGDKTIIREQRIIKAGDVPGALVVTFDKPEAGKLSTDLKVHSALHPKGFSVQANAQHMNISPERTEKEFADAQATFVKVLESFKVTKSDAKK